MSYAPKAYLKLALADIETGHEPRHEEKADIVCIIFFNDACIDKLYFTNLDHQTNIPLLETTDKIGLIFQSKETSDIIGCISFSALLFMPFKGKQFTQWVTLFDSPEDDEFDGEIGEHDEETPRVLLHFRVENFPANNAGSQSKLPPKAPVHAEEDNKVQGSNNSMVNPFNTSQSNPNNSFKSTEGKGGEHSSTKSSPNRNTKDFLKSSPSFENFVERDHIFTQPPKPEVAGRSPIQEASPLRNKTVKETLDRSDRNPTGYNPTSQGNSQPNLPDDINMENLEHKINDLITMLQLRNPRNEPEVPFIGDSKSENAQNLKLLRLEIDRNKELTENIRQLEEHLANSDKLYDQLEKKADERYNELLQQDRAINEENYTLRQKITELETELNRARANSISVPQSTQDTRPSAIDNSVISKYVEKIDALEQARRAQADQLQSLTKAYQNEVENNKRNAAQEEESIKQLNQIIQEINLSNRKYAEQVQACADEKLKLEKIILNYEGKVKSLELKISAQNSEIDHCHNQIAGLNKEKSQLENTYQTLKASIDRAIEEKEDEIIAINENLTATEKKFEELAVEYDKFKNEREVLLREIEFLKTKQDLNPRVHQLEKSLSDAENTITKLQESLNINQKLYNDLAQYQTKPNETVDRKRHEEAESQIRDLIQRLNAKSKECDQLQYQIGDYRLDSTELDELHSANILLSDRLNTIKTDDAQIRDALHLARHQLFLTAAELIKQTSIALDQSTIIKSMNDQMQTLDESLKTAFADIRKLHNSLEQAKRIDDYEPYVPKKNDEVDQRLSEIMNRTKMPIKFIRIGEGLYIFGSKRVHVKILNGKLVIRMGGGYMMLEEFIRLYAHQELMKIKTTRSDQIQYTDMEYEDAPPEARPNQFVRDDGYYEQNSLIKELDYNRDSEIRVIPKSSPKRGNFDRSVTYDNSRGNISANSHRFDDSVYEEDDVKQNVIYDISPQSYNSNKKVRKPTTATQRSKEYSDQGSSSRLYSGGDVSRGSNISGTRTTDTSPYRSGTQSRTVKK